MSPEHLTAAEVVAELARLAVDEELDPEARRLLGVVLYDGPERVTVDTARALLVAAHELRRGVGAIEDLRHAAALALRSAAFADLARGGEARQPGLTR